MFEKKIVECYSEMISQMDELRETADHIFVICTCTKENPEAEGTRICCDGFFAERGKIITKEIAWAENREIDIVPFLMDMDMLGSGLANIYQEFGRGAPMPVATKLIYNAQQGSLQASMNNNESDRCRSHQDLHNEFMQEIMNKHHFTMYQRPEKKGFWSRLFNK